MRGAIGFDARIDMIMNIRYAPDVLRGAEDAGGLVPFVIEQAEGRISQYQVTGSLKEPKYEKLKLPVGNALSSKMSGVAQNIKGQSSESGKRPN
jgi:hypothetical protein